MNRDQLKSNLCMQDNATIDSIMEDFEAELANKRQKINVSEIEVSGNHYRSLERLFTTNTASMLVPLAREVEILDLNIRDKIGWHLDRIGEINPNEWVLVGVYAAGMVERQLKMNELNFLFGEYIISILTDNGANVASQSNVIKRLNERVHKEVAEINK